MGQKDDRLENEGRFVTVIKGEYRHCLMGGR